jgi:DNA-3-methyladenine glycosylase II
MANLDRLAEAAQIVARTDPILSELLNRLGPPPRWARPPGLASLLHIILEQQVSLASGRAAMRRLRASCRGRVSAKRICQLGPEGLIREARLTRQKAEYVYATAEACQTRSLKLGSLRAAPDEEIRAQLTAIRGIGPWTANIYMMMVLGRPDILPLGDLALAIELQILCRLKCRPNDVWIERRSRRWRPWRSVAVRMIWHSYLDRLGRHHEIGPVPKNSRS